MACHKFPYRWRIEDGYPASGINYHGCTVFGTFICGGGSTMGYKLSGYHHLGGVEIDPSIASIYKLNHNPEHLFIEDLRKFNSRNDLPPCLYNLDLLDGSPPCSTFSMAGSREKAWGKKKIFKEGQAEQTLDDLVFIYCDTIAKLKPKVCLLENVSGLVKGNARSYCNRIVKRLDDAGYRVQVFLLNAANMGVPQTRQRTFFIGIRKEFCYLPKLIMNVEESVIPFSECADDSDTTRTLSDTMFEHWRDRKPGDTNFSKIMQRKIGRDNLYFNTVFAHKDRVAPTITACDCTVRYEYPRVLNEIERKLVSTFPVDYNGNGQIVFLTGMSVAPVQMAHIGDAIYNQWLKPIKEK